MENVTALAGMLHAAYEELEKVIKELAAAKQTEQMWYEMYLRGQREILDLKGTDKGENTCSNTNSL